jgi:DNA-binding FadR family transcriptional regulator
MRPPNDTLSEHKAIIKAIQSRNAKAAAELMMEHHLKSRKRILSMMKGNQ